MLGYTANALEEGKGILIDSWHSLPRARRNGQKKKVCKAVVAIKLFYV